MLFSIFMATAATAFVSLEPSAPLADLYVDAAAANCASGTGTVSAPVCSISAAVALAAAGDTIRIAPGTYVENVGIGMDLELIGMGGPDVTILDGGGTGSVVVVSVASTVRLQGLTLTGGSAPIGGGIDFLGDLVLVNTTITGNVATGYGGGGIGGVGGGDALTLVGCEITNNSAPAGDGGGLLLWDAECTMTRTLVEGNSANYYGGGIELLGNNTTDYGLQVIDSTVRDNQATGGDGGGIFAGGNRFLLRGSTVSGNTASNAGGGVRVFGSGFEIVNSTISGNTADYGGGLGTLGNLEPRSLQHTTITNNTALSGGGGGVFSSSNGPDVEMLNTILAGNLLLDPSYYPNAGQDAFGSFTSLGHNLVGEGASGITNGIQNDLAGTPLSVLDPELGPLQPNGGFSETHDLLSTSPAIDAGDPLDFESVDQRGAMRPQAGAPDMGAVEKGTIGSDELCNGDGGDGMGCTVCPCGNNAPAGTIGGCVNSFSLSGLLLRSGTASLSSTDLRYEAENLPSSTTAVLLSGSAVAPTNPANPCFGTGSGIQSASFDGLRCVVQNLLRHGVRAADANGRIGVSTNGWGNPNGFFNFGAFTLGETRFFQVVYREDPASACQTGLNTTQASSVTFLP